MILFNTGENENLLCEKHHAGCWTDKKIYKTQSFPQDPKGIYII